MVNNKTIFFGNIKRLRGHEFHYSEIINNHKDLKLIYKLKKGKGIINGYDGAYLNRCIASYMHIHFINSMIFKQFYRKLLQLLQKVTKVHGKPPKNDKKSNKRLNENSFIKGKL